MWFTRPAHFYRTQLIAEKIAYVFGYVILITDHCLAVIKLADLYIRIERAVPSSDGSRQDVVVGAIVANGERTPRTERLYRRHRIYV